MKGRIFNAQEVQSILNGSKVMFRGVIKPQPEFQSQYVINAIRLVDKCPYKVGEEIFVKESFFEHDNKILFRASHQKLTTHFLGSIKWKPAQHMKQEHSRLFLRITGINVERLQDISEEDCCNEGFGAVFLRDYKRPKFIEFWNATHKKPEEKWEASPWVFAYSYEVIKND